MSYCRWSSDNFGCDLYVYEDAHGGWTTHVAGNRVVGDVPKVEWPETVPEGETEKRAVFERVAAQHQAQMDWLKTAEYAPIGLPCGGQSFNDGSLEDLLARLLSLRDMGYRFPDYVIETVRAEMADEAEHKG